jgi:predicted phage terminase large subunit-like protein
MLGDLAMDLFEGRARRLIVTMPPRHGKTAFLARYFAGWWLGRRPRSRVIAVSYKDTLARLASKGARDDLGRHGETVFGVTSIGRASTKDWNPVVDRLPTEGGYFATSVGGECTGRGADLIVVDDLVKGATECRSQALRDFAHEFLRTDVLTRLAPGGAVIMIGTRWHEDDVIGRILHGQESAGEEDHVYAHPWRLVSLPAIAEAGDALGRTPGEALWPERYPVRELLGIRSELVRGDPHAWEALYQCRPAPPGGAFFRREWIRYYGPSERPPLESLTRFACLDLAGSSKTWADYTALLSVGVDTPTGTIYVLDVVRDRIEGPDLLPLLRREVARWELQAVFVEQVASGLPAAVVSDLPLRAIRPDRDKVSRALPATAAMEAGRVRLPAGAVWLAEFERELLAFPEGRHDDQVDVLAYAVVLARDASSGHGARSERRLHTSDYMRGDR